MLVSGLRLFQPQEDTEKAHSALEGKKRPNMKYKKEGVKKSASLCLWSNLGSLHPYLLSSLLSNYFDLATIVISTSFDLFS